MAVTVWLLIGTCQESSGGIVLELLLCDSLLLIQFTLIHITHVNAVYSGLTVTLLAEHSHLPAIISIVYCSICSLALASHAKCMFTDPGTIPSSAVPPAEVQRTISVHAMCSHCECYKPPGAHHCRICNRCISHMDHHCPWMNNCVRRSSTVLVDDFEDDGKCGSVGVACICWSFAHFSILFNIYHSSFCVGWGWESK